MGERNTYNPRFPGGEESSPHTGGPSLSIAVIVLFILFLIVSGNNPFASFNFTLDETLNTQSPTTQ